MDDERNRGLAAQQEDLPHLLDEYHKARHQLALFSGLLLAWETVELGKVTKVSFPGLEISPVDPKGVSRLLVMLIVYCGFRIGVEWWQCGEARRNKSASIIDLVAAYAIGIFAVAVASLQELTDFRMAKALTPTTGAGAGIGFFILAPLVVRAMKWIQRKKLFAEKSAPNTRQLWTILSGSGIAALLGLLAAFWPHFGPLLAFGMMIGSSVHGFVVGIIAAKHGGSPAWWTILGWIQERLLAWSEGKGSIMLTLTPEQQEQVREATGKLTDTLEFSIMDLEERIAPAIRGCI